MKQPCVYILASGRNGTLYIGVTSDLAKRIWEHRNKVLDGFTQKHDVQKLVYVEFHQDMENAILREKRLKNWRRDWKLELVEKGNPQWIDLYEKIQT